MRQLLILLCCLALACSAMVTPVTIADISGDGAIHQIAATGGASWIQFVAPVSNANAARVGDANITTSRGVPIAAGGALFFPPLAADTRNDQTDRRYALSTVYYLVQSGDKLSITYVP